MTAKPTHCAYCGRRKAVDRDHVITRKLFPSPRPSDLITVPACRKCNAVSSDAEEYFINAVLAHHRAVGGAAEPGAYGYAWVRDFLPNPKISRWKDHFEALDALLFEDPEGRLKRV